MAAFFKWCVKTGIAGMISVILLSVFTLVYSNSGVHITNLSQATDYCWEPDQYKANMVEGFSWLRMDADGFNNESKFSDLKEVDILIMGSSHMEAVNVGRTENAGALLKRLIPEYSVYNIGISGHTIYHCVNNLDSAVSYYNPTKYVVIETGMIELDIDMMERVLNGEFARIPSYDSGLVYSIQKKLPVALLVYRQIENWRAAAVKRNVEAVTADGAEVGEIDTGKPEYQEVLSRFLDEIRNACGNREIIILYHPPTGIDDAGNFLTEDRDPVIQFQATCEDRGLHFVDMEADFKALYENEHILAHGFTNTAVGEGHLNRHGHKAVAEKLAKTIEEIENGAE